MISQISFGNPVNVGPNDLDGIAIRFPFTVLTIREGVEKDSTSSHTITVQFSGDLLHAWHLGSSIAPLENIALIKTLFEFARREVESAAIAGRLEHHSKIDLHTGNSSKSNPFDPKKIPNTSGFSFEVDTKNPIGF